MSGNIFWLASYPKSGNTWMRALLANYLWAKDEPVNINNLGGGPIASARQAFDDHVGVEASDLTQSEIERYRPFVYDHISAQAKEPAFLKIHDAFTYTEAGYPLISKAATAGVIYLLRNPLDVAVSLAHHTNMSIDRSVTKMGNADYTFVGNADRLHNQLAQRLLTWSGHVTSWTDESGLNVLVVRYEDTKADPIASFSRVVRFCGFEPDAQRVAKAVDFARFDRLKEQEETHGFGEKMARAKSFFRKGKVGSWREQLTDAHVETLLRDHASVMARFGYLSPEGAPVY